MHKFYKIFILVFFIYFIAVGAYLLNAPTSLPEALRGGPADPAVFMTPKQVEQSFMFSRIKDILYFLGGPLDWAIYLLILGTGLNYGFRKAAASFSKRFFLQTAVYVLFLSFVTALLRFPLDYFSFYINHLYGISNELFSRWITDQLKSFVLNLVFMIPTVWVLYLLMKKSPRRWWIWTWLISIPVAVFLMYIQPVVLDPVFHKFTPLQDSSLKHDILGMASKAGIPVNQVYQVDMSKETNSLNAYVNGIGSNTRIVLWDTTLQKLKKDEILFIMAHEMGHYVLKHMQWLLAGTIGLTLGALVLLRLVLNWAVRKFGRTWKIPRVDDLSSLPVILLILSVLSFLSMPVQNAVSRSYEHAADNYAMQTYGNPEAAVRSFQKLALAGLTEVNPPAVVKYFLYGHPTLMERIEFVNHFGKK